MNPLPQVLVVGQTPPPAHGQAAMTQYFLEGIYTKIELHHVRMAFSDSIEKVGTFQLRKISHLLALTVKILCKRVTSGADILYYPPASPNLIPFLRDCFLLISTRWAFQTTVFHFHAAGLSTFYQSLPRLLRFLFRVAYFHPDLSICLTQGSTDDARICKSRQIKIIPNGVPDTTILVKNVSMSLNQKPRILFLSTLSMDKGAGVLLQSIQILLHRQVQLICEFAGPFASEGEKQTLTRLATELQLGDNIFWAGPLHDTAKWKSYHSADIFCFPSHHPTEGLPVVLVEAMMFGLPIVTTDWRGNPDLVLNNKTGFLTEPRSPTSMANKLEELILDPLLRRRMGAAGRDHYVAHYRVEGFQRRMEEALASAFRTQQKSEK